MARYELALSPRARRQLAEVLPLSVAAAAHEFLVRPLADNPWRVGKPLVAPLAGCHSARRGEYRVVYRIDDETRVVTVVAVTHRSTAYRSS